MTDRAADAGKFPAGLPFDFELTKFVAILLATLGATYVVLCAKALITGEALYGFADFHALWVSGVLAHDGQPLINYDAGALQRSRSRMEWIRIAKIRFPIRRRRSCCSPRSGG